VALQKEIRVTDELLELILRLAGTEMIVVGGQALAFWAAYYRMPTPEIAITKDVDLIGGAADVERLARGLDAKAQYPRRNGSSLLVGQVIKELPNGDYLNIDVMSGVYGDVATATLARRAVLAENPAGHFRIMHPIDVLQGRLDSVYALADKQNEHGIAQLQLAIHMTLRFVRDIASQDTGTTARSSRPIVLRHLARIETLALSDAGRKAARRYGVHVADAIDPTTVAHIKPFISKKLPQLRKLMSEMRRLELKELD
jgi:hypothetical protein